MVIDTSAIIAVRLDEAGAAHIARAIEASSQRLLSAANLLEASIVIESRKSEEGGRELDLLLFAPPSKSLRSIKTRPKPRAPPGGALARAAIWRG
jgi:uncharacterized protein with PIN domain